MVRVAKVDKVVKAVKAVRGNKRPKAVGPKEPNSRLATPPPAGTEITASKVVGKTGIITTKTTDNAKGADKMVIIATILIVAAEPPVSLP
jgi:hypothetical protein